MKSFHSTCMTADRNNNNNNNTIHPYSSSSSAAVHDSSEVCACLPEVFRTEGSVQVRIHISGALLHSLRVGDKRFCLDPFPLDLGAVLHPQVYERHAWHLVAVRPSENRHSPGFGKTRAVVVRRHGWGGRVWDEDTQCVSGFSSGSKSFQLELHSLSV